MNLSGMKVKSIKPGGIYHAPKGFQFSLVIDGIEIRNSDLHSSTSTCKQKMLEKVRFLKHKHGIDL